MVLAIWEGTSHRQILDGLEVMQRKGAHNLLFAHLEGVAEPKALALIQQQVASHLALAAKEQEASAEKLFADLARFTGETLRRRS